MVATITVTPQRQDELLSLAHINMQAGDAPFNRVTIVSIDEVRWILDYFSWFGEIDAQSELRPPDGHQVPSYEFRRADFKRADFRGAILQGVDLRGVTLVEADFSRAHLEFSDLSKSDLRGARFCDAFLIDTILDRAVLIQADFTNAKLTRAKLRGANCAGGRFVHAHLGASIGAGAMFVLADLSGANIDQADYDGVLLQDAKLPNASLVQCRLKLADLSRVQLRNANLEQANLQGATLEHTDCSGTNFSAADLGGASMRGAYFDTWTQLNTTTLRVRPKGMRWHILPRWADLHWDNVPLAQITWTDRDVLLDEAIARWPKRFGQTIRPDQRLGLVQDAVRANRQLALALRSQGLSQEADEFNFHADLLQRIVYRIQGYRGRYTLATVLETITGYGYRPGRSVVSYLLIVALFAVAYFALGLSTGHSLSWYEALIVSLTAFHGRGFFTAAFNPGDPQAIIAACEAVIGLFIEICFIATFTQRFFGK